MPIEFGPPAAGVQPFQIQPVQYTDPLETLARMQQLRTGNIQAQTAQLGLDQARLNMESKKGVIRWLADMNPAATQETQPAEAPSPAPSPFVIPSVPGAIGAPTTIPAGPAATPATAPQTPPSSDSSFLGRMARDASKYGILPDDWFAIQNHYLEYKQKNATLTEAQKKIDSDNADALAGAYRQLAQKKTSDQGDLNAVNNGLIARGIPREWLMTTYPVVHGDMTPQMQIRAHGNTQLKLAQMQESEKTEAQIAQETAAKEASETTTQKNQRNLAAADIRAAINPATGAIDDPSIYAGIQKQYPLVKLPPKSTAPALQAFLGSTVEEEKQPKYLLEQRELELMNAYKGNPQSLQARVDQSIDPVKYPDLNRRALNEARNQVSYADLNKVIEKYAGLASEQEKTIATETSPQVIGARVGQAVATERATAPLKVAQEIQKQTQLAALSPGGFANIYNPQERTRAETEYNKISQEYGDKAGSAQGLQDFIKAAQSGNKAAPGLIPLATVRQMVNRVNRQELEGVSGAAGNVWDRLQGELGKLTEGQPIPPAVLKDLNTISGIMENAAYRTYQNKVDILNQSHGLSADKAIQPVRRIGQVTPARSGAGGPPPGAPPGAVAVPLKTGTTLWLAPNAAAQFRKDHPDRVK